MNWDKKKPALILLLVLNWGGYLFLLNFNSVVNIRCCLMAVEVNHLNMNPTRLIYVKEEEQPLGKVNADQHRHPQCLDFCYFVSGCEHALYRS